MSSKSTKYLVIAFLIGLLFFSTNPKMGTHKEAINNEFKKQNPVSGVLGAGRIASALPVYNDYFLFSTTEVDGTLVSIGLLTKVFVVVNMNL